MFDLDRFREVLSTLRRNALRTTLTAVGVFWGVFLLILMLGMGNGLERGTKSAMGGLATNSLYIWGERTSVPYLGMSPGRFVKLTMDDADALRRVPGVRAVAPRVTLGGRGGSKSVTRGEKTADATVMGDTPDYLEVEPMEIRGRFINELDMKERRKVAVIGPRIAELLFEQGEEPIGRTITIRNADFLVVGVFAVTATGDRGDRHLSTIYTPLTTFQKTLNTSPWIHYIALLSHDDVRAGSIQDELTALLRKRHRASPDDPQAVGSFNADAEYQKIVNLFKAISILIYLVGSATLMAGLVGVSNIMMVSVRERTREIGIRNAIGATPRAVIGQIVMEAVALASAAGYMALVAGVGILEAVSAVVANAGPSQVNMFAAPSVSLTTALGAALAVAFGGGLAGLFPALHAAGIRTVTALRDE
jgi:putative ABC transport system permease protein